MKMLKLRTIIGVVGGIIVGTLLGIGLASRANPPRSETPKVIRAQKFELVDKQGHIVADFGPIPYFGHGVPYFPGYSLNFYVPHNLGTGMSIGIMDKMPMISLDNSKEKSRIALLAYSDRPPVIWLADGKIGKQYYIRIPQKK